MLLGTQLAPQHSPALEHIQYLDVERLRKAAQSAKPFPFVVIDNFLTPNFAEQVACAYPSFNEAKNIGKAFTAINERGKVQVVNLAKFAPPILELHHALAHPKFLEQLSYIFDIPNIMADEELIGGGIHETGPQGLLDVHVDFNFIGGRNLHRRLNLLLYFNKGWEDAWGGNVELWDKDVMQCHHSFSPIFNRCLVFETSDFSFHGVSEVACPPSEVRKSFAAYYYTKEPPIGWDGSMHSTIFKPRPNQKFKGRVLMPLERIWKQVGRFPKKLRAALMPSLYACKSKKVI